MKPLLPPLRRFGALPTPTSGLPTSVMIAIAHPPSQLPVAPPSPPTPTHPTVRTLPQECHLPEAGGQGWGRDLDARPHDDRQFTAGVAGFPPTPATPCPGRGGSRHGRQRPTHPPAPVRYPHPPLPDPGGEGRRRTRGACPGRPRPGGPCRRNTGGSAAQGGRRQRRRQMVLLPAFPPVHGLRVTRLVR
ncbi:hypothetical protein chiPu_0023006 [Chiloscyllium punctatum]|uniref:Uncharacterized protein n=1 Tax=Chiloscyllium punctatum TaxID=137246 RepID=A0A401T8K6_CHIPU|nr:hypothetical protein [Chiloscyllium punctatum]